MALKKVIAVGGIVAIGFALSLAGKAAQKGKTQKGKENVQLPAAVRKAVNDNKLGAKIAKLEVEKESGITFYDIEFKAGRGEIEIAEDGTVMDMETVVELSDVPKPALAAIRKAAVGARIRQVSKSEVHAELKEGKIVKLTNLKYVYEADLQKGKRWAEVEVASDGRLIEAPRWRQAGAEEKEGTGGQACAVRSPNPFLGSTTAC
jgi:uncharacterized membrane protein YkoI